MRLSSCPTSTPLLLPLLLLLLLLVSSLAALAVPVAASAPATFSSCRCFPGDKCWPSVQTWQSFNQSVGGGLIATVPIGAPCHDPDFNADQCRNIQSQWHDPTIHYTSSSSIMAPLYRNQSCDAFTSRSQACQLGNYVSYAVKASSPSHVSLAIGFAQEHNIRFVIRNTGHDYNGKSTGAGAIAIWMHALNSIQLLDYRESSGQGGYGGGGGAEGYVGKALKVGAGVQFFDANAFAHQHGLVVVGGQCLSVGLAGGYSQGGGHSTLSSRFGLGSDQALEWEVFDARGRFLKASRSVNPDLYWALSGGGGGTYGVVWSLTVRAHPESFTTGASLNFSRDGSNGNVSEDTYYKAIEQYQTSLPAIVDAGAWASGVVTSGSFFLTLIGYGLHKDQAERLLAPIKSNLTDLGIKFDSTISELPTWNETVAAFSGTTSVGVDQYVSWLLPRSLVPGSDSNTNSSSSSSSSSKTSKNAEIVNAYREINKAGALVIGFAMKPTKPTNGYDNSVLPAWRDTLIDALIALPWNDTAPWADDVAAQKMLSTDLAPRLSSLAPQSGAYLNEADPLQPNWQQAFYGKNYPKLKSIKTQYDPSSFFYALGAVGSEAWTQRNDGRLCRA